MMFKITPENAVLSVKYWLKLIVCWPPPLIETTKDRILRNITWCIAVIFPGHCIPLSVLSAVTGPPDPAKLTRNLAEFLSMFTTVLKMVTSRYQRLRLQTACTDMENFLKTAGPREKAILDRYVDMCGTFYVFAEIMSLSGATAFCFSPLASSQPLPGQLEYPFPWRDSPKLIALLYALQVVAIFQAAAGLVIDIQVALLMWVAAAQFELLAEDFQNARHLTELHKCIQRHQQLTASVHEITIIVQCFAVNVMFTTGMINITAGYQIVTQQQIGVVVQFFCLFVCSLIEVAIYAWPANNLLVVSENISWAAYSSSWIGQSQEMMKEVNIVSMRAQKPMVIAVSGILPELNLDFYGKFVVSSFSYFTTLRAVVG